MSFWWQVPPFMRTGEVYHLKHYDRKRKIVYTDIPEVSMEPDTEEIYYSASEPVMTKELYLSLTDKEKVEWPGLADCDLQEAIVQFGEKMKSIGIVYKYGDDMLDEFMRLESVTREMKQEQIRKEEVQEEVRIIEKSRGRAR